MSSTSLSAMRVCCRCNDDCAVAGCSVSKEEALLRRASYSGGSYPTASSIPRELQSFLPEGAQTDFIPSPEPARARRTQNQLPEACKMVWGMLVRVGSDIVRIVCLREWRKWLWKRGWTWPWARRGSVCASVGWFHYRATARLSFHQLTLC
jgi:hypothetical protein